MLLVVQGTERTDECLNIFLEFVPGGSIASLINRFGAQSIFPLGSFVSFFLFCPAVASSPIVS